MKSLFSRLNDRQKSSSSKEPSAYKFWLPSQSDSEARKPRNDGVVAPERPNIEKRSTSRTARPLQTPQVVVAELPPQVEYTRSSRPQPAASTSRSNVPQHSVPVPAKPHGVSTSRESASAEPPLRSETYPPFQTPLVSSRDLPPRAMRSRGPRESVVVQPPVQWHPPGVASSRVPEDLPKDRYRPPDRYESGDDRRGRAEDRERQERHERRRERERERLREKENQDREHAKAKDRLDREVADREQRERELREAQEARQKEQRDREVQRQAEDLQRQRQAEELQRQREEQEARQREERIREEQEKERQRRREERHREREEREKDIQRQKEELLRTEQRRREEIHRQREETNRLRDELAQRRRDDLQRRKEEVQRRQREREEQEQRQREQRLKEEKDREDREREQKEIQRQKEEKERELQRERERDLQRHREEWERQMQKQREEREQKQKEEWEREQQVQLQRQREEREQKLREEREIQRQKEEREQKLREQKQKEDRERELQVQRQREERDQRQREERELQLQKEEREQEAQKQKEKEEREQKLREERERDVQRHREEREYKLREEQRQREELQRQKEREERDRLAQQQKQQEEREQRQREERERDIQRQREREERDRLFQMQKQQEEREERQREELQRQKEREERDRLQKLQEEREQRQREERERDIQRQREEREREVQRLKEEREFQRQKEEREREIQRQKDREERERAAFQLQKQQEEQQRQREERERALQFQRQQEERDRALQLQKQQEERERALQAQRQQEERDRALVLQKQREKDERERELQLLRQKEERERVLQLQKQQEEREREQRLKEERERELKLKEEQRQREELERELQRQREERDREVQRLKEERENQRQSEERARELRQREERERDLQRQRDQEAQAQRQKEEQRQREERDRQRERERERERYRLDQEEKDRERRRERDRRTRDRRDQHPRGGEPRPPTQSQDATKPDALRKVESDSENPRRHRDHEPPPTSRRDFDRDLPRDRRNNRVRAEATDGEQDPRSRTYYRSGRHDAGWVSDANPKRMSVVAPPPSGPLPETPPPDDGESSDSSSNRRGISQPTSRQRKTSGIPKTSTRQADPAIVKPPNDHPTSGQHDPRPPPPIAANSLQPAEFMGPPAPSSMTRTPFSQTFYGQPAIHAEQQAEFTRRETVRLKVSDANDKEVEPTKMDSRPPIHQAMLQNVSAGPSVKEVNPPKNQTAASHSANTGLADSYQPVDPAANGVEPLRSATFLPTAQQTMVPPVASERVNRTPPRQADAAIPLDPPPRFASSVPSSSVEHIPLRSVDHDTGSAHQSKERLPLAHQFPPATASGKAPTAEALKLAPSDAPRGWGEAFRFPMQRQPTQEKGLEPIAYDLPVKGEVPSEKATTQVSSFPPPLPLPRRTSAGPSSVGASINRPHTAMGHKEPPFLSRVALQHAPPPVSEEAPSSKEHLHQQPPAIDYRAAPLAPIPSRGTIPAPEEKVTGWTNRAIGNSLARPSTSMGGRNFAHGPSKSIPNVYPSTPLVLSTTLQKTRSTTNEEQAQTTAHRPTPTAAKPFAWESLQHAGPTPSDTLRERREQLVGISGPINSLAPFPITNEHRSYLAPNHLSLDVATEYQPEAQPTFERAPPTVPSGGSAEVYRKLVETQPGMQTPIFSNTFLISPPAPLVLPRLDNGDIGTRHKPSEQSHTSSAIPPTAVEHSPHRHEGLLVQPTHVQPMTSATGEPGTYRPPSSVVRPPPVPSTPLFQPIDVLPRSGIHPSLAIVSAPTGPESRHAPAYMAPPFPIPPKALEIRPSTSSSGTSHPTASLNLLSSPSSGQDHPYPQGHVISLVAVPEEGKVESKPSPRLHLTEASVTPAETQAIQREIRQAPAHTGLPSGRGHQESVLLPPQTYPALSQATAISAAIPMYAAVHVTNSSKERLPALPSDVHVFSSSQERLVDKASLGDRRPSIQVHGSHQPSPRTGQAQPIAPGYLHGQTDKQSSRGLPSTAPTPITTPKGGWVPIQEKPSPDIHPRVAVDLPLEEGRNFVNEPPIHPPQRLPREGYLTAQPVERIKPTERGKSETVKVTPVPPELKYQVTPEVHQPTFIAPRIRTSSRPQIMDGPRDLGVEKESRSSARGEAGKGKDIAAVASGTPFVPPSSRLELPEPPHDSLKGHCDHQQKKHAPAPPSAGRPMGKEADLEGKEVGLSKPFDSPPSLGFFSQTLVDALRPSRSRAPSKTYEPPETVRPVGLMNDSQPTKRSEHPQPKPDGRKETLTTTEQAHHRGLDVPYADRQRTAVPIIDATPVSNSLPAKIHHPVLIEILSPPPTQMTSRQVTNDRPAHSLPAPAHEATPPAPKARDSPHRRRQDIEDLADPPPRQHVFTSGQRPDTRPVVVPGRSNEQTAPSGHELISRKAKVDTGIATMPLYTSPPVAPLEQALPLSAPPRIQAFDERLGYSSASAQARLQQQTHTVSQSHPKIHYPEDDGGHRRPSLDAGVETGRATGRSQPPHKHHHTPSLPVNVITGSTPAPQTNPNPPPRMPIPALDKPLEPSVPPKPSAAIAQQISIPRGSSEETILMTPKSPVQTIPLQPTISGQSITPSVTSQTGKRHRILSIFRRDKQAPPVVEIVTPPEPEPAPPRPQPVQIQAPPAVRKINPQDIWQPPPRGDSSPESRHYEEATPSPPKKKTIQPPLSIPVPIHGAHKELVRENTFTPFRFLKSKRNRAVSVVSVEAQDGTANNTVIGSPTASMHSQVPPIFIPPLRDPVRYAKEWRDGEEADHRKAKKKGRQRRRPPGVTFDLEEEPPENQRVVKPRPVSRRRKRIPTRPAEEAEA